MLGIKRLHVMIIKQFALLFVGTFFISLFVLMMQFVWQYVDTLIGKGLTLDILGQFFWYMSLMMVPQALPLAILLSSLITFGNLGESSELTAIKAAGISLMQVLLPLAVIVVGIACGSFYFQNNVGPDSKKKMARLLISMKQKSPELEIPEGIFYDGIPQCNIYVQRKDLNTGMLYGIMIYRMTNSYDDAAIILADSGMLQSTAEKKHLQLSLYSGEWFENMRSSELGGDATVPYRRETFWKKRILIDFDGDFNLADANVWGQNAQAKSLNQIRIDIDSLNHTYDSIGRTYFTDAKKITYAIQGASKADSLRALQASRRQEYNFDSLYNKLSADKQRMAVNNALSKVNQHMSELDFKSMVTQEGDYDLRLHKIEAINKFVLAFSCIIFFFIGAPLGAIIRKGGLGIPIIVSVVVFIIFYILDNTGYRMARGGMWAIWFGKRLATAVLAPTAVFVTYKARAHPPERGGDHLCPRAQPEVAPEHHQGVLQIPARPRDRAHQRGTRGGDRGPGQHPRPDGHLATEPLPHRVGEGPHASVRAQVAQHHGRHPGSAGCLPLHPHVDLQAPPAQGPAGNQADQQQHHRAYQGKKT